MFHSVLEELDSLGSSKPVPFLGDIKRSSVLLGQSPSPADQGSVEDVGLASVVIEVDVFEAAQLLWIGGILIDLIIHEVLIWAYFIPNQLHNVRVKCH